MSRPIEKNDLQNWPFKNKSLGFNIPKFNGIDLIYTDDNVTKVSYTNNSKIVFILNLVYDIRNNLISVKEEEI